MFRDSQGFRDLFVDRASYSMNKEMIISSNGHETRVAILDDLVAEIFVERSAIAASRATSIRAASRRRPGMQSAFVDIGLERDGFLYVSDVVSPSDLFR